MLNQRENAMEVIHWGKPEYVPNVLQAYKNCVLPSGIIDQPLQEGNDVFGVHWLATREGSIPDNRRFMFENITDWKQYVKFPDLDQFDFKTMADKELEGTDRTSQIIVLMQLTGNFERMAAFMGFENALCAFYEDPDSCGEFFDAMSDFRIQCMDKQINAYKPDVINYFDDIATARGTFMSPDSYRKIIKPYQKKIVDYVHSKGILFEQHTCGYIEEIIPDYLELGIDIWDPAQISNDIPKLLKQCRGKMVISGGWDSQGKPGRPDATVEELVDEAVRCLREYGTQGGYMLFPVLMAPEDALPFQDYRLPEFFLRYNKLAGLRNY